MTFGMTVILSLLGFLNSLARVKNAFVTGVKTDTVWFGSQLPIQPYSEAVLRLSVFIVSYAMSYLCAVIQVFLSHVFQKSW